MGKDAEVKELLLSASWRGNLLLVVLFGLNLFWKQSDVPILSLFFLFGLNFKLKKFFQNSIMTKKIGSQYFFSVENAIQLTIRVTITKIDKKKSNDPHKFY